MARYIDADALKAKYEQMLPEIGDGYHKETLQDVLFELEYAPTVSPDEVRGVGKWETKRNRIARWRECSCCHDAELVKTLRYYGTYEQHSKDAADAIEELLAAVPHWISVEERLPDVAEKVLTYNGDFVSENWLCTVASKVGRVNVWAYSEGFVTHWMPLPAPPKEDAK